MSDSVSGADADVPISVVLGRIKQLGPVIAENADTNVDMQGGFIEKWGEFHLSTNGLTTSENEPVICDAIHAALPTSLALQKRYPRDIVSWNPADTRMGLHNDCFVVSNPDGGSFFCDAANARMLRDAICAATSRGFFSGENCNIHLLEAHYSCNAILKRRRPLPAFGAEVCYQKGFSRRLENSRQFCQGQPQSGL